MTLTDDQFERIVSEVIRRLLSQGVAVAQHPSTATELTLTEKVITTRTLEGRLTGVKRLIVSQKAIVTPAVKDELKERHIDLIRH
jgi:hypothetical protein